MIEKVDTSHEAVKKTGKAFIIAFTAIAAFIFLKHSHVSGLTGWDWGEAIRVDSWKWFLGLGVVIYLLCQAAYPVMKPFHYAWMTFAFALGWFWTRVFLSIFFFLVLTPVGVLVRLMGKDLMDEKLDRSAKSYWTKRDLSMYDPKHITRTF